MNELHLEWKASAQKSTVRFPENVFEALGELPLATGALLVTDTNVASLYRKQAEEALPSVPIHVMPAGEQYKTESTLFALLRAMAEAGLRRNSTLIALGGGVVGDLGGLAAALYMRGIRLIQVPTTLLAQVDSSVGGKTAVDFCGVKNLVGAFKQPETVLIDGRFLRTLPRRELRCGLGEIVKHAALSETVFRSVCAQNDLFDLGFLAEIVPENIAFKASVVQKDPLETGLRKCLNLGHTTAHALELSSSLSHGECVLWGLIFESKLAQRHCKTDGGFLQKLISLSFAALGSRQWPSLQTVRLALLDKKNTAEGTVTLTVPIALGEFALLELPIERYEKELTEIKEELA